MITERRERDTFVATHALEHRDAECECKLEHSVAKLGHCRSCPYYGVAPPTRPQVALAPGCPPRHADGTPHDFDWATYADDREGYGVCYCGYDACSDTYWNML